MADDEMIAPSGIANLGGRFFDDCHLNPDHFRFLRIAGAAEMVEGTLAI